MTNPMGHLDRLIRGAHARFIVMALALIVFASFLTPTRAQLQQSGGPGSTVTVGSALPAGTNVIGHVIHDTGSTTAVTGNVTVVQPTGSSLHVAVDSAPSTAVTGTFWQTTQPVSGTVTVNALPAGSNLVGYTRPPNACGTTAYEAGLQFLTNASTQLTPTSTCITVIILNNTDTVSHAVSIQDQSTICNSAACNILSAFSIPANSQLLIPLYGAKFTSGIKWNADANTKVVADIIGNQ